MCTPGNLLVLQQDADHLPQAEVRPEGKLAYPIAVRVGVTVGPEVALEILALALRAETSRPPRISRISGVRFQAAVFGVEVIAGRSVADERAVDRPRRREHLARRQIRPVARD